MNRHEFQDDLFAPHGLPSDAATADGCTGLRGPDQLADANLLNKLETANLERAVTLVSTLAARQPDGTVTALRKLFRRVSGILADANEEIPEQRAALDALVNIGGVSARTAVADLVNGSYIAPGSVPAGLRAAGELGVSVKVDRVRDGLGAQDPSTRWWGIWATATYDLAGCLYAAMTDRIRHDPDDDVRAAAACRLASVGDSSAHADLTARLDNNDVGTLSLEAVVEALEPRADRDTVVVLVRWLEQFRLTRTQREWIRDVFNATPADTAHLLERLIGEADP